MIHGDSRRNARIERIKAEPFPQFGCAGRHKGNGAPDCPLDLHHHHDWFCNLPTPWEWHLAGRTGPIETRSRAGIRP
jgi:hypothetical protein